jgi:hypothetical protein
MQKFQNLNAESFRDFFFFSILGKISDFSNADVAVDQYHRFQVSRSLQEWRMYNIWHVPNYFYDRLGLLFFRRMYSSWQTWEWMLTGFQLPGRGFCQVCDSNQNRHAPLIYVSFFHLNIFSCRQ